MCLHTVKIGGQTQQIFPVGRLAGKHGPHGVRLTLCQIGGIGLDAAHQRNELVDVIGCLFTQKQLRGLFVVIVVIDVLHHGLGEGLTILHSQFVLDLNDALISFLRDFNAFFRSHGAAVVASAGVVAHIEAIVVDFKLAVGIVSRVGIIQQHSHPRLPQAEAAGKVVQLCNIGCVVDVAVICSDGGFYIGIGIQIGLKVGHIALGHHVAEIDEFAFGAVVHQIVSNRVTAKNVGLGEVGGRGDINHLSGFLVLGCDIGEFTVKGRFHIVPHGFEHTGGVHGAVGQGQGGFLVVGDGTGLVAGRIVDFEAYLFGEVGLVLGGLGLFAAGRRFSPGASRLVHDGGAASGQGGQQHGARQHKAGKFSHFHCILLNFYYPFTPPIFTPFAKYFWM